MTDTSNFLHPHRFPFFSTAYFSASNNDRGKCFLFLYFKCLPVLLAKHSLYRNMAAWKKKKYLSNSQEVSELGSHLKATPFAKVLISQNSARLRHPTAVGHPMKKRKKKNEKKKFCHKCFVSLTGATERKVY